MPTPIIAGQTELNLLFRSADKIGMDGTGNQIDLLARVLGAAGLRHAVIAQNVANVNTPGYRRLDVSFEDTLARQLGQSGSARKPTAPEVVEAEGGPERADGNNVDIDLEMGQLNKNTLLYRTVAQIMAQQLAQLRSAIAGR